MHHDDSGNDSDELDEFEESMDDRKVRPPIKNHAVTNKHYDEEYEVSQDLSVAESYDGRDKPKEKERKLHNDMYDEAVEVSQSIDVGMSMNKPTGFAMNKDSDRNSTKDAKQDYKDAKSSGSSSGLQRNTEQTRSQTINNSNFDEALEFSHSGSEESIDTTAKGRPNNNSNSKPPQSNTATFQQQQHAHAQAQAQTLQAQKLAPQAQQPPIQAQPQKKPAYQEHKDDEDEGDSNDDGEAEESYDNIEGAYNSKDYHHLNVAAEVRDLFQYIDRYKPQEVELDTPLKCFIPEYIPAIGELDPFLKIPRPDNKEDGSGLKFLDEPATNQSDPTVLELQLRAKSKKLQYGDVAVRSIENADKNPSKIEKWIQDINDLHRSKPPPQVNYKKNMPDFDRLMEAWPEDFEALLATTPLPSPDLDLSLGEYAKVLCSILDIPVYDNPIESLHLMFSLFIEFKNNPHFQSRLADNQAEAKDYGSDGRNMGSKYGGADVLEIDSADYK